MIWIYGDDNSDRRRFPIITPLLILLNCYVFIAFQDCGVNDSFTYAYATVPAEIVTGEDIIGSVHENGRAISAPLFRTPIPVYLTLITALFMHGGFWHLFGNMLFLFVFGDNVEDRLGRIRFLLFYLCCGIAASLGHIAASYISGANIYTPLLGASGAISGVLGGYLCYYPRKKIKALFWLLIIPIRFRLSAFVVIGVWFAMQLFSAVGSIGSVGGGVAYGAHIAGFLAGFALVVLRKRNQPRRMRF